MCWSFSCHFVTESRTISRFFFFCTSTSCFSLIYCFFFLPSCFVLMLPDACVSSSPHPTLHPWFKLPLSHCLSVFMYYFCLIALLCSLLFFSLLLPWVFISIIPPSSSSNTHRWWSRGGWRWVWSLFFTATIVANGIHVWDLNSPPPSRQCPT